MAYTTEKEAKESLYLNGEEKFGPLSSKAYALFAPFALRNMYKYAIDDIVKAKAKNILEVGAGPGYLSIELARRLPSSKIYCIDPSEGMKKVGQNNIAKSGLKNVEYLLGSSRHVPLNSKFDVIFSTLSFHHWKKKSESIAYLLKFLAKKGELLVYEYNKDGLGMILGLLVGNHSLSEEEIRRLGVEKKFKIWIKKRGRIISFKITRKSTPKSFK